MFDTRTLHDSHNKYFYPEISQIFQIKFGNFQQGSIYYLKRYKLWKKIHLMDKYIKVITDQKNRVSQYLTPVSYVGCWKY